MSGWTLILAVTAPFIAASLVALVLILRANTRQATDGEALGFWADTRREG